MRMASELLEWYTHYRKHKDIFLKQITSMTPDAEGTIVALKDGSSEKAVIVDAIQSFTSLLAPLPKDGKITIVTKNSKQAVDMLAKEWDTVKVYSQLIILFVNPRSSTDTKWLVKPAVHDRVSERAALKEGLLSMASSVEFTN